MLKRVSLIMFGILLAVSGGIAYTSLQKPEISTERKEGFIAYEPASFKNALAAGKTLVVHVHADWCPACKQQVPVLQALSASTDFASVDFIRVNFDTQKAFLAENRVPVQSVILIFKDGEPAGRIIGVVEAGPLKQRIKAAVVGA